MVDEEVADGDEDADDDDEIVWITSRRVRELIGDAGGEEVLWPITTSRRRYLSIARAADGFMHSNCDRVVLASCPVHYHKTG